MLTDATFEFIEEIDRQKDSASLVASFQRLIGLFGLRYFMVGDPRPPLPQDGHLWATTWPNEWLSRWTSRGYLQDDPIVRELRRKSLPHRWSTSEGAADKTGTRILEEAGEFQMNAGFAVPVYNGHGLSVVVSMATDNYDLGNKEEVCLHMAAIYFHAQLERIRAQGVLPRLSRLTPRERECLSWLAAGKTDWEIAQILNIAEQTVHEYVQNALIKLNATTRAQAVAIAIHTRQIIL